jgi:hypothetical protein
MYGITFGNTKVQKWITSVLISIVSSVFLTQPIQLILTAVFLASVFRKATDLFQDKVKDGHIDTSATVKEDASVGDGPKFFNQSAVVGTNTTELEFIRKQRIREQKLKGIIKRLVVHSIFLTFLFITAFSVRNTNSFNYQNALTTLFNDYPAVCILIKINIPIALFYLLYSKKD